MDHKNMINQVLQVLIKNQMNKINKWMHIYIHKWIIIQNKLKKH